jgi:hypothetical protein
MSSSVISTGTFRASSSAILRLNPIASQRAKKEMEERRSDIKTYTLPIIFAGDVDRMFFLQAHYKKFLNSKKTSAYRSQVMKKYPTTVGKFYHELVDHSGRVSAEEFWLRYDYRCGDIVRVIRELKSIQQESKKQLAKEKKKKSKSWSAKVSSQREQFKKESPRSASMSWMSIRSVASTKKSSVSSVQGVVEASATADTADEEFQESMSKDHVESFKKSFGGGDVAFASPDQSAKALKEQGDSLEGSNLPSIFRSNPQSGPINDTTISGPSRDLKFPTMMVGVWLLTLILAMVAQSPSLWMSQGFANRMCSPIRPGTVVEGAQLFAVENESGASLTLTAPWWVPSSMKDKVFDYLCASDAHGGSHIQTQLTCKVQSKTFFRGDDVPVFSATISQIGGEEDGKVLIHARSTKSLSVDSGGTKLIAEKYDGRLKVYESPWALF